MNFLNLDYSYCTLPSKFYQLVKPTAFIKPELVFVNDGLLSELHISPKNHQEILALLLGNDSSFAQAYAGHQFGGFTKLGDGRAIVLGEYLTPLNQRFDIQLKGSGRTLYSRGGDGKATLRAMLREYLISEAMFHLKIPTSRSLAVAKTGDLVLRETDQEGAVVARIMKSHIRVGTFEYARQFGSTEDLQALTNYTIQRLYPEVLNEENPTLAFLKKVISAQIDLVVNWMRVGFIHGVMNTDNVAISGETFDYGPCAFMNAYHSETVFSSIDKNGRYAFGNQPNIIKWNMARFAESLLPILHSNLENALKLAQTCFNEFDQILAEKFYKMMLLKLGIEMQSQEGNILVNELLHLMENLKLDYTNTFLTLSNDMYEINSPMNEPEFQTWLEKWKKAIESSTSFEKARKLMTENNPAFIPRNHLVEEALESAVNGNFDLINQLLIVHRKPYNYQEDLKYFTTPPSEVFETRYATFCGT
ncbi:MAG: YdiU family protein [Cytophagales bacterium]|nr:MAG: YdiU family protein [Cytophagales bacterium]